MPRERVERVIDVNLAADILRSRVLGILLPQGDGPPADENALLPPVQAASASPGLIAKRVKCLNKMRSLLQRLMLKPEEGLRLRATAKGLQLPGSVLLYPFTRLK